ncbi:MAG TPA: serpin family protein [Thermoanaerobaculia bacterium]|nr:serpin family protein [Thermoanaerobaculia bacterium]
MNRLVIGGTALLISLRAVAGGPGATEAKFPAGNTEFALELHRRVRADGGNVFFSPFSIAEALAMAWSGARGETARQMAKALHFPAGEDDVHAGFAELERRVAAVQAGGRVELAVANSLWPQTGEPLLPRFLALLKDSYGAAPSAVDYRKSPDEARRTINRWVERKTRDRIMDLLPPDSVSDDTRLVLANAIYFKGKWKKPFEKTETKDAPFHLQDGKSVPAPFMHGSPRAGYLEIEGAQLLQLPYEGDDLSLVVLLPRKADGLAALEDGLTARRLSEWISSASRARQAVEVFLPRFRMETGFRLKAALTSLGMTDAFDPRRADFSAMSSTPSGLFISEGFHKAFVDVNEEGTEAAAATGVAVMPTSMPPPKPVFRADRPFLFLIRDDETGSVLFLGRVTDPTRHERGGPAS